MANLRKRLLPSVLALAMIVGALPVAALGANQTNAAALSQEEAMHHTVTIEKYGDLSDIVTYHQYGTITTKEGTVLVSCEARIDEYDAGNPCHIYLWRSTDGGRSFGEHIIVADCTKNKCSPDENECGKGITGHFYSNPTLVEDRVTGRIFIFYSEIVGNPQQYARVFYTYSDDDGATWAEGVEITDLFANDPHGRDLHVTGPGHGLQIQSGAYAGRLVLDVWHSDPSATSTVTKKYGPSFLYSDDGGETWQVSEYVEVEYHIDETRVAELAGGVLVLNGRAKDETRKQAFSVDGGATWSTPTTWTSIGKYQNCDSGFVSQVNEDGTILVTTHMKTDTYVRNTLYAYVSYDNGATWSEGAELWKHDNLPWGGTGASDVTVIDENTFGCVHGTRWKNNDLMYEVFNLEYADADGNDYTCAAQIGITNYATLAEAVDAAKAGDTIVLRANLLTAQDVTIDKTVAVDLNGYSLWTDDLHDLCADGGSAAYDAKTGLWNFVSSHVEPMHQTVTIEKYGDLRDIVTYHQFGSVVTKAGTVLVTSEARLDEFDSGNPMHIYAWRSTDGGKSFSEHIVVADATKDPCSPDENKLANGVHGHCYTNPTPVVDLETGRITVFYSESFNDGLSKVMYCYSEDDGLTWSEGVEITDLFADDPYERVVHFVGPGHGVQISSGPYAGRLVMAVWHRHTIDLSVGQRQYGLSAIYSDDGGKTWKSSEYADIGVRMSEARIAELAGGVLVINSRAFDNTRKQLYSVDGGVTWSFPTTWTSIGRYGDCDSGFVTDVGKNGTVMVTTHMKTGTEVRNTIYAYVSYDNGETWSDGVELWSDLSLPAGGTGASDVIYVGNGVYGSVHGTRWKNNDLLFELFNVEYMTDEKNTHKPAAQIGVTDYDTLAEAVDAAKAGDTVIVRKNHLVAQDVVINKAIAIDLNGYALWTDDLNDLCADDCEAVYDAKTGLWNVLAAAEDPGCLSEVLNEDFSNGLPTGWVAEEHEDVTWSYADGKVTADFVRDNSLATPYLTTPAVFDGVTRFSASFDVTFYKLGSQGWSALYYRMTNTEGKPLSILMEMRDGGEMNISCQSHPTAVTNATSHAFSRPTVTVTDNAATAHVRFEGEVDSSKRLTLTLYIGDANMGQAVYDISALHLQSILFIGTPVNTGVHANHRIAFDNVVVSAVGEHTYVSDCDRVCEACGYTRRSKTAHAYDNACDVDCNECGAERVIEHRFAGDCDTQCDECGTERDPLADHSYDNDRDAECNVCGDLREVAPLKNGWVKEAGKWAYYVDDVKLVNRWQKDSNGWCYLGEDGYMLTNAWVKDSVGWCYVGANGYCVTNQWMKDSKGWCYLNASGRMATNQWIKDSQGWCYVGADGYCVTNRWMKDSKGWCYLNASGRMATSQWVKDSKGWCYVGADGYCVTSRWMKDSKGWCYLDANGRMMVSRWLKDGGKWYYLDANGYMVANKSLKIGGKTYHFNAGGVCTNP